MQVAKLIKELAYSVTVRIQYKTTLRSFITKVLQYKVGLNRRIKFVCIAMCSAVMNVCSCDSIKYYYNTLNSSGLAVVNLHTVPGFRW